MNNIKTYAGLYEFAQEMGMMYGPGFPENVVIRVEVEFHEYRQMLEDFHRVVYVKPEDLHLRHGNFRDKRPSFTIKFGQITFLVSMEEPTYNFKIC